MGIRVVWDSKDQKTIRLDFEGKWNFLDFDYAMNECNGMVKKVEHPVDLIYNLAASGPLAAGAVLDLRALREPLPENHGVIAVSGDKIFARAVVSILSRIYPELGEAFVMADSVNDARILLAQAAQQREHA